MKRFKIITCISENLGIGKDGDLLYRIPNDLANFKRMTKGCVVVMGRKTFESIGKPLDKRISIVITSDKEYCIDSDPNAYIVHSVQEAVDLCNAMFKDRRWYVIGGASVYSQFIDADLVDEMYVTKVLGEAQADTFFPDVFDKWGKFYESGLQTCDKTGLTYIFTTYTRKT